MIKANGIIFVQSSDQRFVTAYNRQLKTECDGLITYGMSGSVHGNSVITSGDLIHQAFEDESIEKISEVVHFAIELDSLIPLVLVDIQQTHLVDSHLMILSIMNPIMQIYRKVEPIQAEQVLIVGSPMGSMSTPMYKNCVRKAIVSQIHGKILILDMISQTGHEGSSVYSTDGEYMGMLLAPTQIGDHNSKYITLAISWPGIYEIITQGRVFQQLQRSNDLIEYLKRVSCHVSQNHLYGSGTLLKLRSKTYVFTAQHILNNSIKDVQLLVNSHKGKLVNTSDSDYDFAIGSITEDLFGVPLHKIRRTEPIEGQLVYAVGYSLIDTTSPLITRGHVVKVVRDWNNRIVAFMTDCFIHNGYSGGGIFDQEGMLMGLISFNIHQKHEGLICDMNFAFSILIFIKIFEDLEENKPTAEKDFTLKSEFVQQMKQLQHRFEVPSINYKPKL